MMVHCRVLPGGDRPVSFTDIFQNFKLSPKASEKFARMAKISAPLFVPFKVA